MPFTLPRRFLPCQSIFSTPNHLSVPHYVLDRHLNLNVSSYIIHKENEVLCITGFLAPRVLPPSLSLQPYETWRERRLMEERQTVEAGDGGPGREAVTPVTAAPQDTSTASHVWLRCARGRVSLESVIISVDLCFFSRICR